MADLHHLLAIYVHAHQTGNSVPPHIDAEARAALAAAPPAPIRVADGEREELAADLDECADSCVLAEKPYWAKPMRRAAALLRQPAPPTPPEGLTDEQLFKLAADALGYVSITHSDEDLPGAYEASGLELLAAMRAAIAADRAARPAP
jgi:hypothetical protein